MIILFLAI